MEQLQMEYVAFDERDFLEAQKYDFAIVFLKENVPHHLWNGRVFLAQLTMSSGRELSEFWAQGWGLASADAEWPSSRQRKVLLSTHSPAGELHCAPKPPHDPPELLFCGYTKDLNKPEGLAYADSGTGWFVQKHQWRKLLSKTMYRIYTICGESS